MAFLVSPGVQVKEIDLTNVIPATSASIGAIAMPAVWGPINEIVTVGSEKSLVETFGQPNDATYKGFMQAAQFLSYGNNLKVVRVVGDNCYNAAMNTTTLVRNEAHFQQQFSSLTSGTWVMARNAGVLGNSLGISVWPADSTKAFTTWSVTPSGGDTISLDTLFNGAPGVSDYVSDLGGSTDEVHVVVYDETGGITGKKGTILETYANVSQASDAKAADGATNYWVNVINNESDWIYVGNDHPQLTQSNDAAAGTTFTTSQTSSVTDDINQLLSGGADGDAVTTGQVNLAYDYFADAETVEVSLIMQGHDNVAVANHIASMAASRKDCVAFISPPTSTDTLAELVSWAGTDVTAQSSYVFADSGPLYVYDKYNDKYRWIQASGSCAGLAAHADLVADAWFSPAGFTRGGLRNVTKLAWNPTQAERDAIYKLGVNPVVAFPGQGTILFGDKTMQTKASAFDRIGVRRLFITLEKAISQASRAQLFEFNDEFTRAQFRNMVEPFLRDVKGRRGVTDFKVVCDTTNNTGNVIDTNRFVADIFIKPARSINFITLNFIATRTGVEFSEISGGN